MTDTDWLKNATDDELEEADRMARETYFPEEEEEEDDDQT